MVDNFSAVKKSRVFLQLQQEFCSRTSFFKDGIDEIVNNCYLDLFNKTNRKLTLRQETFKVAKYGQIIYQMCKFSVCTSFRLSSLNFPT